VSEANKEEGSPNAEEGSPNAEVGTPNAEVGSSRKEEGNLRRAIPHAAASRHFVKGGARRRCVANRLGAGGAPLAGGKGERAEAGKPDAEGSDRRRFGRGGEDNAAARLLAVAALHDADKKAHVIAENAA